MGKAADRSATIAFVACAPRRPWIQSHTHKSFTASPHVLVSALAARAQPAGAHCLKSAFSFCVACRCPPVTGTLPTKMVRSSCSAVYLCGAACASAATGDAAASASLLCSVALSGLERAPGASGVPWSSALVVVRAEPPFAGTCASCLPAALRLCFFVRFSFSDAAASDAAASGTLCDATPCCREVVSGRGSAVCLVDERRPCSPLRRFLSPGSR